MAIPATEKGSSLSFRLDPYRGSHRFEIANRFITLDRRGAVIRKILGCGLKVNLALPARAFKGIAARGFENQDGSVTVSLELMHHDPELCVPLLLSGDMVDISADWHSWSRLMQLPMLIIGVDGEPSPLQRMLGKLMVETPWQRRKRITSSKYRPNFLRRRKAGNISTVKKLEPAELIARR